MLSVRRCEVSWVSVGTESCIECIVLLYFQTSNSGTVYKLNTVQFKKKRLVPLTKTAVPLTKISHKHSSWRKGRKEDRSVLAKAR